MGHSTETGVSRAASSLRVERLETDGWRAVVTDGEEKTLAFARGRLASRRRRRSTAHE